MPRKSAFPTLEAYYDAKRHQTQKYRDSTRGRRSNFYASWEAWELELLMVWRRTDRELGSIIQRSIKAIQHQRHNLKVAEILNQAPSTAIRASRVTGYARNHYTKGSFMDKLIPANVELNNGRTLRIIDRQVFMQVMNPTQCQINSMLYRIMHDLDGIDALDAIDIDDNAALSGGSVVLDSGEGFSVSHDDTELFGTLLHVYVNESGIPAYEIDWDMGSRVISALYVAID